jgi:hypothetical protein
VDNGAPNLELPANPGKRLALCLGFRTQHNRLAVLIQQSQLEVVPLVCLVPRHFDLNHDRASPAARPPFSQSPDEGEDRAPRLGARWSPTRWLGEGSTVMANVVTGGDEPPLLLVHG